MNTFWQVAGPKGCGDVVFEITSEWIEVGSKTVEGGAVDCDVVLLGFGIIHSEAICGSEALTTRNLTPEGWMWSLYSE